MVLDCEARHSPPNRPMPRLGSKAAYISAYVEGRCNLSLTFSGDASSQGASIANTVQ